MKLKDLGLFTKPQTKYFEGGYVKFATENQELFFEIIKVDSNHQFSIVQDKVISKEQLAKLFSYKTIIEVFQA